jgi:hypothetical protein
MKKYTVTSEDLAFILGWYCSDVLADAMGIPENIRQDYTKEEARAALSLYESEFADLAADGLLTPIIDETLL